MKSEYPYLDRRFRSEAQRAGQLPKWEESLRFNIQCAKSIEEAIVSHSSGGVLQSGAAETVLEQYGLQRAGFVLANSVKWNFRNTSARVSDWSMSIRVPYDQKALSRFLIHADDRLLDAFVKQVWEARQALGLYGTEHCAGEWGGVDYQGKTLVLNADSTDRTVTSLKDQLWYAADGFGCRPENWGCSIRAVRLADGKTEELDRALFAGALDEQYLPDWAAEKLAELRGPQQEQPEPSSGGMEMT
ncbi:DUF3849 domain-containing protein [uncultured Oscillibacter sp.]|uniref:DUF3849 domain-containing protein n=1 Tax=uncultured Oscillibacter sp. TaxID=876091 RepID=UPI002608DFC3|nr:DUF3849 domain-containing protein [uncultured Oscillibacter sp.]